ncbi:MAG TPA: NfeD family protein, partial [Candidatus Ozemobacteraceae bacterium]|nr:NfeD family protein [Candidatus Ozemobacteraceae bacterium]
SHGLSPFSPLMIATFATLFGGLGFISLGLLSIFSNIIPSGLTNFVSVAVSGSLALVLASYFSFFLVRIFVKTETASNIATSRLIGREAEVALDLEPGKIGEIVYLHGGSRQNNMAKLADGCQPIRKGQMVEIVSIQENIMVVKPWENPGEARS